MATIGGKRKQTVSSFAVPVIIITVLLTIGGGMLWWLQHAAPPRQGPQLTDEAKDYIRAGYLKLSGVEMKANKSYMNQMVVEITGKLTNAGPRDVRQVDLNCVFYDAYGQLVLRELVSIVKPKTAGLKTGETKPFRMAFDALSENWNQQMPQLVIAQIIFE